MNDPKCDREAEDGCLHLHDNKCRPCEYYDECEYIESLTRRSVEKEIARVSILGTEYRIIESEDDPYLKKADAYCDWTNQTIVTINFDSLGEDMELHDRERYRRKVLRHEIIHAFMHESGLHESATFDDVHYEQMVDWTAIQFPKMLDAFQSLGII